MNSSLIIDLCDHCTKPFDTSIVPNSTDDIPTIVVPSFKLVLCRRCASKFRKSHPYTEMFVCQLTWAVVGRFN